MTLLSTDAIVAAALARRGVAAATPAWAVWMFAVWISTVGPLLSFGRGELVSRLEPDTGLAQAIF